MFLRCMKIVAITLVVIMLIVTAVKAVVPKKSTEKTTRTTTVEMFDEETGNPIERVSSTKEAAKVSASTEEQITRFCNSFSERDIEALAKTLYGEADCVASEAERSMVVWTVLNRFDSNYFDDTIYEICTANLQFTGYDPDNPVTDRNLALIMDVIARWEREKNGETNVGRTLPREFYFFRADSKPSIGEWHNAFFAYSEGNYGDKIWYDYLNPIENPYQ